MIKLKIKEAAQRLHKSEQFVRIGLQRGILPFGYAVKVSNKYSYHISRKQFNNYLGADEDDSDLQQEGTNTYY